MLESPDEERTSIIEDFVKRRNSTTNSLFELSNRSDASLNGSQASLNNLDSPSSLTKPVSRTDSPVARTLESTGNATNDNKADASLTKSQRVDSPVTQTSEIDATGDNKQRTPLKFNLETDDSEQVSRDYYKNGDHHNNDEDDDGERIASCDSVDYQITNEEVARYKFSDGTLRVIESTFGRKRNQSGSLEKTGFISMWDFAGQYIFYATHQVFVTSVQLIALSCQFLSVFIVAQSILLSTNCNSS